jgi:hypothetical protein
MAYLRERPGGGVYFIKTCKRMRTCLRKRRRNVFLNSKQLANHEIVSIFLSLNSYNLSHFGCRAYEKAGPTGSAEK